MYKKLSILIVLSVAIFALFSPFTKALAVTPTLNISGTGDGDSVQVTVNGDPSSSILFYYYKTGVGQEIKSLGTTDLNGVYSTIISSAQYGISSNSVVHVTTGGLNGPKSSNVTWPTVTGVSSTNSLSLSQTGVVLTVGQSSTITASNVGTGTIYLSNNSNPLIANINISSNNQLTITGNSYGTTVATVCLTTNTSNCVSAYVTVQNSGAQALSFNQSSVSLSAGQSVSVQITGGSGIYTVLNNSSQSPNLITTNISGSTITLSTTGTTGTSSITVCTTNLSSCGIINVTIGGTSSTTGITFSQNNPTVSISQSLDISIYGPTNTLFYVSSNSVPNLVQANLTGNTLTLIGIASGTSTIKVCASINNCGSLTATIAYTATSGKLTLSQDVVSLNIGQASNITVSGGTMPYSILGGTTSTHHASLNGNILTVTGVSAGSGSMNVCSSGGGCVTLSITINGVGSNTTLPAGCTTTTLYSAITGLPCNSSNTVVVAPGCISTTKYSPVTGEVCLNYTGVAPTPTPAPAPVNNYKFTLSLKVGSLGTEVTELQKKLTSLGYYTGAIDGDYGPRTEKAVKALQKANGLEQVGVVGPATRAVLNK